MSYMKRSFREKYMVKSCAVLPTLYITGRVTWMTNMAALERKQPASEPNGFSQQPLPLTASDPNTSVRHPVPATVR
jgi:hypothetical protein